MLGGFTPQTVSAPADHPCCRPTLLPPACPPCTCLRLHFFINHECNPPPPDNRLTGVQYNYDFSTRCGNDERYGLWELAKRWLQTVSEPC